MSLPRGPEGRPRPGSAGRDSILRAGPLRPVRGSIPRAAALVLLALTAVATGCRTGGGGRRPGNETVEYLNRAWERYTEQYVRPPGYVVDTSRERAPVTSEGQAYALLRAVLVRDGETFERVFRWTEEHLRRGDGLYSWLYHPDSGVVDRNTASDADQEIALALILASEAFGRPAYLERARELLAAVRRHESLELPDGWFPAAGNWAVDGRIANLSYFLPYAYPYFDRIHPQGDWAAVRSAGYRLVDRWLARPGVRLVPDFLRVESDGSPEPVPSDAGLSGTFSFDAVRLYWRVASACVLFSRPRACSDPVGTDVIAGLIARDGGLMSEYTTSGQPLSAMDSPSFYGAVLPALQLHRPELGRAVRRSELGGERRASLLTRGDRYYDRNWVWFGLAASSGFLERRLPDPAEVGRAGERAGGS